MSVRHPAPDATGPTAGQGVPSRRRFWGILASAALAVVVVVLVVAGVAASNGTSPDAAGTSETSTSSPRSTGATPATPGAEPSAPPTATTPAPVAPPAPPESAAGELAPPAAQAPVPLTEPAAAVPGVVFGVGAVEAVNGVARGPGEVGGPSLRFTVTVRNDTADTVNLTATVVNLFFGADQSPATELTASGGAPFPEAVAPGATQQGMFVFAVPTDQRDRVRIAVDYSVGVPIVLFEGAAPR
ncbi:hypothetical protein E3O25_05045 [Cryobacterium sp. TMT1-3]|uniref:DUF4352 domain-containing protein n=1 Tax=Cryobacterium luteum TaxID=1424661 RepID=A0A1H8BMG2_9MICO|nr:MULTISPECIES: hypothetical protein [Cryobacterium]TFB89071.1 hypothetical protein E3O10_09190 [Cryobacterium luteum]TFC29593.1 hypothetical protein E3O25_05045 [Cryobacterium sp. TMT1-3]SEM83952.1 hypothetical protein SAMN05216281_10232 [Cryobacterium luteum]